MLKARRLKQIAESNKPVFTSTETEWWLAEAPARREATRPEIPVKPADLKKELPAASNASAQDAAADETAGVHARSNYDFLLVKDPGSRKATETKKKEEMTWDAKMSCFVMS